MIVYPILMQETHRYVCYTHAPSDTHIVTSIPDDDRCPVCGGKDWARFPVVECPGCSEWACDMDADLFRAMHGCFGGSL